MDFDERLIERKHVETAIGRYRRERPKHHPAKSAFLQWRGEKLPAKYILRLAFQNATGCWPKSETLTGGKASVRVLRNIGFEAIYEKQERKSWNKSGVKSARRAALKRILEERYGPVETEWRAQGITVPDLDERTGLDAHLKRILNAIEAHRSIAVRGRKGHRLAFDFYLTELSIPIEFDERQHFTPLRAVSLRSYPADVFLGFDRARWIQLCEEIRAGDNSPAYRDEQRAFYDSIRDMFAPQVGLLPVIRIFEEDVHWERKGDTSDAGKQLLAEVESLIQRGQCTNHARDAYNHLIG